MPGLQTRPFTALPPVGAAVRRASTSQVMQLVSGWLTRRRTRQALAIMDDHLLRDIGLTAQDASDELRKPFWRP